MVLMNKFKQLTRRNQRGRAPACSSRNFSSSGMMSKVRHGGPFHSGRMQVYQAGFTSMPRNFPDIANFWVHMTRMTIICSATAAV
ncbi:hypothetical protein IG631_08585 [Alternaria alternata]|nr:hypothetical protein IG631_08585 [Alternaria alternata]